VRRLQKPKTTKIVTSTRIGTNYIARSKIQPTIVGVHAVIES